MTPIRILPAATVATALAALALINPASAGVVFSESFEAPVVSGFVQNTVPSGGTWVGSTTGFGATNRGLYNETVAWPATPPFTTPYGAQAYCCSYTNSFLTTATGATGQTLTANVPYKVTFNTAVDTSITSANYKVELLASGTVLASATGSVTTKDMSAARSLTFTPDAANPHLGKDVGIRLGFTNLRVLYDNIRLITGHDMNPSPATGVVMPSGNTVLNWTNMPPNPPGGNVPVDVFFGTNPAALTQVVDGILTSTATVNAPSAGTYYWRVDSYPDGNPNGTPVTGDLFSFIVTDTDGDGFPDTYELANTIPSSPTALDPSTDLDLDGLTALQEFDYGTNPTDNDTDNDTLLDGPELTGVGLRPATFPVDFDSDNDGLSDGAESNTGTWVSATNTGTNPKDNDKDKDGLLDGAETNTGTLVDKNNTGTDPFAPDTDNDGAGDYYEVYACFTSPFNSNDKPRVPYPLPDPDASAGVTNKPVKVYIMSGQSNIVGLGKVYGTEDKSLETMTLRQNKFPNLVNDAGGWTQRQDVRYRGVISAIHNKGLTPGCGADSNSMGPELGFGHIMGWFHDEPVLLLKSSIGNRSLAWDILPPGSPGYGSPIPTTPGAWYGGKQYDMYFKDELQWAHPDAAVTNVVDVLDNFAAQYPNWASQGFEIAGFVWWQGEKDLGNTTHANQYEANLVRLIDSLRTYYTDRYPGKVATNAPFVLGTLGEASLAMTTPANGVAIRDAHLAVDSTTGSNPQINVKTVYTNPLSEGGEGNNHYLNRAGTYVLVGDAMGRAMVDLLVAASGPDVTPPTPNPMSFAMAPTAVNTSTVGMVATTAVDPSEPVQYWFENTSNSTNSGWITSTRWDSTGLTDGVSHDFRVKAKDSAGNETAFSAVASAAPGNDVTKPTPDPMTFAGPLQVLGENSIRMAANTASDINGVQYEFVCTVGGGPGSGWQSSLEFTATGLNPGTSYTYVVRAKDSAGNTTNNSAPASASTIAPDTTPPSPATSSFITPPNALGIDVINMTATTTTDPSGVEYYFEETTENPGGSDSGWQNSSTYNDSGLQPGTEYSYRVRARDKSPAQNVSTWSTGASATTAVPDTTKPLAVSLSPANGASNVGISGNLVVTFDEEITVGTGNITLNNLTDATQTDITVTDTTQVSVSGAVLTLNPTANLLKGKTYAIQIAATAIEDLSGNSFDGILNDITWAFATETPPPAGVVFADNFEAGANIYGGTTPDVTTYTLANTSRQANTTLWVRPTVAFGAASNGLIDESENSGANFTDPVGSQAYAFRYTNSGVTSAAGKIGVLTAGTTYTMSFDVVMDGWDNNSAAGVQAGFAYDARLIAFASGNDRATGGTMLKKITGNASSDGLYKTVSFTYTTGDIADSAYLGYDLGIRFIGATSSANIDNVSISTAGPGGPGPVASFAISPIASPQKVGTPITGITLTAKDASSATATGFTGTVTFGGTGGFTGTSANFTAGVLSGVSVTPTVAGSNLTFTINDGASHTGSATIATIRTPYEAWATGGVVFNQDTNNDGVDNGMAWLLGAATPAENALNKLPAAFRSGANLRLTFRCLKSTKRGGVVLKVQSSSDMRVSNPWTSIEAAVPDTDSTVNGVVFDTTDDGDYINVIADIPASGAKLFGRLSAVNTP